MTREAADVPEPFRIDLDPHRDTIVVSPHGEIDIATCERVYSRVREVVDAGFRRVVLDLRAVTFVDSSGLRAVLQACATTREARADFALIAGPDPVQRLFEVTGTSSVLHFIDVADLDRS